MRRLEFRVSSPAKAGSWRSVPVQVVQLTGASWELFPAPFPVIATAPNEPPVVAGAQLEYLVWTGEAVRRISAVSLPRCRSW